MMLTPVSERPKIAMCNFLPAPDALLQFARENGFDGIDWSFFLDDLPETGADEKRLAKNIRALAPLEVRYHCPFLRLDIGHEDAEKRFRAMDIFNRIITTVARVEGKCLSLHVGLGRDSTRMLSWAATVDNLGRLVRFARSHGIRLCLENLAWGWTSKPNLFEKLVRLTGAGVTVDIGHAHACETIRTQQFEFEDFVRPHPGIVHNAHVYHTEIEGVGHMPPRDPGDILARLAVLYDAGCRWWVIEIRETGPLMTTRAIIEKCIDSILSGESIAGTA